MMNLIKKIAFMSLAVSIATTNLVVTVYAQSDDAETKKIAQLGKTIQEMRKNTKNSTDVAREISISNAQPVTLKNIRAEILKARYGANYDSYVSSVEELEKARNSRVLRKERLHRIGKKAGFAPEKIEDDHAALTELMASRKAINDVINSEALGQSIDTQKTYKMSDLNQALKAAKDQVSYPPTDENHQAIKGSLISDPLDLDTELIQPTLADAVTYVQGLTKRIQEIKALYNLDKEDEL